MQDFQCILRSFVITTVPLISSRKAHVLDFLFVSLTSLASRYFFTLFIQSLFLGPSNSLDVPVDFSASLFLCFLLPFIICNMLFVIQAFLFLSVLVPISCFSMLLSILCILFHYSCTYFRYFKRGRILQVLKFDGSSRGSLKNIQFYQRLKVANYQVVVAVYVDCGVCLYFLQTISVSMIYQNEVYLVRNNIVRQGYSPRRGK